MEYESAKSLSLSGYRSESSVVGALAALKMAESEVEMAKIDLANCDLRAPFDGVIDSVNAKKGAFINSSNQAAHIIECKKYLVKTNIPEPIINKLTMKDAQITLPGYKQNLKGIVENVSMQSMEGTRTYPIEISVPELDEQCVNIIGMTADIDLNLYQTQAYLIPAYALSLNDDGLIGIKVLNAENTVKFHLVEILEEDTSGQFWVKIREHDNNSSIKLITHGHTYVKTGAEIKV